MLAEPIAATVWSTSSVLAVQHAGQELVDAHAGLEELVVVAARGQADQLGVVVARQRDQHAHVDAAQRGDLEREVQGVVGDEVGGGDPAALAGGADRGDELGGDAEAGHEVGARRDDLDHRPARSLGRAVDELAQDVLLDARVVGVEVDGLAGGGQPVLEEDRVQAEHGVAGEAQVQVDPQAAVGARGRGTRRRR
jgi:hypothetical protein